MDEKLEKSQFIFNEESNDPPFYWSSSVFKKELKTNIKMAFPVLITNVMQYLITLETMSFCGRLSTSEVEAVGLALSLINATGWCICNGMVTACDTLFSQAFGSDNKKRTGIFFQRGLLMMNLVPIFLFCIHINLEPILIMLGQDPNISRITGQFVIIFTPGIIFMMNYLIFARYMQSQGCLWPPVVAALCGNIFNILSQALFISCLGYGFKVSVVCHTLSYGVMLIFEIIYVLKSKFYVATWPGFQFEAFYDWINMFKLGIAGTGQIALEVFIWEGNIFMGGLLGTTQLATQAIILQMINFIFAMYMAVGIAANIRVGQCLGANKPNRAKTVYRAGTVVIGSCVFVMSILILSLCKYIPRIFTNKENVINMVIDTFPAIYLLMFVDPFAAICAGTLRGCGRQALGGLIIFISYYVLSLPSSIILAFLFKIGVKGLWIGTTVGSVASSASIFFVLECQNWKAQSTSALERVQHKSLKLTNNTTVQNKHAEYLSAIHRPIILKRLMIGLFMVVLFLIALCIRLFLPKELYRPRNFTFV